MKEKKKGSKATPEMLISLAESAKAVNLYAGLIPGPQQMYSGRLDDDYAFSKKSVRNKSQPEA